MPVRWALPRGMSGEPHGTSFEVVDAQLARLERAARQARRVAVQHHVAPAVLVAARSGCRWWPARACSRPGPPGSPRCPGRRWPAGRRAGAAPGTGRPTGARPVIGSWPAGVSTGPVAGGVGQAVVLGAVVGLEVGALGGAAAHLLGHVLGDGRPVVVPVVADRLVGRHVLDQRRGHLDRAVQVAQRQQRVGVLRQLVQRAEHLARAAVERRRLGQHRRAGAQRRAR